jgi:GxxExxY protein
VDSAFSVHSELGPGLLESVYERCLLYELQLRGLPIRRQVPVAVNYKGVRFAAAHRVDLLVDDRVVVELKAVNQMHPVYGAQILTYLKLTGLRLGLLINFNVPTISSGIRRIAL